MPDIVTEKEGNQKEKTDYRKKGVRNRFFEIRGSKRTSSLLNCTGRWVGHVLASLIASLKVGQRHELRSPDCSIWGLMRR